MKLGAFVVVAALAITWGAACLADVPPPDKVPFPSAEKVATSACKGKILSRGLEQRDGVWLYTFEITNRTKRFEVLVDALTGKLASMNEVSSR